MRKLFLFIILAFTFNSCTRGENEVSFRLKYEQQFSIDSSIGVNFPINLEGPPVTTQSSQAFANNNTAANLITSVTMDYAELVLDNPSEEDFSFLKSVEISIEAEGLDPLVLAFSDPVPDETTNTLVLTTSNRQFQDYIKADEIVISTRSVTDEFLTQDHSFTFKCEFLIKGNVLN